MKTLLAIAIFVGTTSSAAAECLSQFYVLTGTVILKDKSPAIGVTVGAAWKEGNSVGGPALTTTDADGSYSIVVEFKPYSAIPGGDWYECKGKLSSLQVSSYSASYYAPPVPVAVVDGESEVRAPPIELYAKINGPD